MDPNRYRFRSLWNLDAPPAAVFDALERVDRYPEWWPEIRAVHRIDDGSGEVVCRASLPYELRFTLHQVRRDPVLRVLEASMVGDLEGRSSWTVTAASGRTVAVFDEEVVATKPLLRRLAPVARPVFRANHSLMMRHGRRGLAAHLH